MHSKSIIEILFEKDKLSLYIEREKNRNFHTWRFIAVYGMHVSAKRSIPLILKEAGWAWSRGIAGISQDTQSAVIFPPMASLKFQIMPGWECL